MQIGIAVDAIDAPDDLVAGLGETPVRCIQGRLERLVDRDLAGIVVGGEAGVTAAFHAGVNAPVLPVDAPVGLEPVPRSTVADALAALADGDATSVPRTVIGADVGDGRRLDGVFEVGAMTTGPAEISEFEIDTADHPIGQLRADGIVVSTPVGSTAYGAAAGGPILGPTVPALAVVPVSPFLTQAHVWVVDDTPVEITVTRDESTVGVYVDDRAAGRLHAGETVTISRAGTFETLRVPQSTVPYRRE